MSDLRAACDRLRINDYPDSHDTADGYVSELREADLWTVANEYLSTHPADGAEPIDEAWLLSQGWAQESNGWWSRRVGEWSCQLMPINDKLHLFVRGQMWPAPITTRSQLRDLLAALGVV